MLSNFSKNASAYMAAALALSINDEKKIGYALQTILGDASKLGILFILFSVLGFPIEFTFAAMSLAVLRPYTGGLHFETYRGCLLFSLGFFSITVPLARFVPLSLSSAQILCGLSLLIILIRAPITSPKRPRYNKEQRLKFKALGIGFVWLHMAAIGVFGMNGYLNAAVWVILAQSVQLLFAQGGESIE